MCSGVSLHNFPNTTDYTTETNEYKLSCYHRESNEIMESSYEWSSTKTNVKNKNNIQFVTNALQNVFEFENPYASYTTWQNSA